MAPTVKDLALSEVGRTRPRQAGEPTAHLAGLEAGVRPVPAAEAALAVGRVVEHARKPDAIVRAQVVALAMVPPTGAPHEHDPLSGETDQDSEPKPDEERIDRDVDRRGVVGAVGCTCSSADGASGPATAATAARDRIWSASSAAGR